MDEHPSDYYTAYKDVRINCLTADERAVIDKLERQASALSAWLLVLSVAVLSVFLLVILT